MIQIQNNFTEMFLMMPSTKIDNNMATRAKHKKISLNDISIATVANTLSLMYKDSDERSRALGPLFFIVISFCLACVFSPLFFQ